MELKAAIAALERLREPCRVELYSDSSYLIDAFTKKWLMRWEAAGWQREGNKPVKNQDLWLKLSKLAKEHQITWRWVRGHDVTEENNRCDALARQGIKELNQSSQTKLSTMHDATV